jgi:hypothetical protein
VEGLPAGHARVSLAAEQAIADIRAEAQRKAANKVRQVLVPWPSTEQRLQGLPGAYKGTRTQALRRDFELTHLYESALRAMRRAGLMNLIEAAGDKQGAGLGRKFLMMAFDAENPGMTRDIVREIFKNADGSTGNDVAKEAARAWLDTIEGLRQRFNAAGGDVGGSSTATRRSRTTARASPRPGARPGSRRPCRCWTAAATCWRTAADGRRRGAPDARQGLGDHHHRRPEQDRAGRVPRHRARANRGSDPRQIHFADGQAWLAYMKQFGRGSLYDAMMATSAA